MLWHTQGVRRISKIDYQGSHGVILIYDINDKNSFINIEKWIKQVEKYTLNNTYKILVGNKIHETNRQVTEEEGKKLADKYGYPFFEVSAKTNQNINELFDCLIKGILNKYGRKTKGYNLHFQKYDNKNKKKMY